MARSRDLFLPTIRVEIKKGKSDEQISSWINSRIDDPSCKRLNRFKHFTDDEIRVVREKKMLSD